MVDPSLGFPGGAASQRPLHGVRVLSGSEVPPNRRNCHLQIPRTLVLKKYILRCKNLRFIFMSLLYHSK